MVGTLTVGLSPSDAALRMVRLLPGLERADGSADLDVERLAACLGGNIRRKDGTINESIRRVIEDRHAMRADKFCWTLDAQRSGSNDERRPNAETEVAE